MKHNFKRFLSLVVAMVMVFGMLPMNVFATEGEPATDVAEVNGVQYATLKEAVAAANTLNTATVIMLADVTLGEKLTISGDVTIEGEYTITRDAAYTGTLFTVNADAELTLAGNLTIDGGNEWVYTKGTPELDMANGDGTKVADHITSAEGGVNATAHLIVNEGTLNVNDVTIENSYSTNGVSVIDAGANSVTTIDGATIQKVAANRSGAVAYIGGSDAVLTIKGDTRITGNFGIGNGGIIQNYGQGTTVNMEGGSIDHNHVGSSGTLYASYSGNANKINTFNMSGGIITENVMEGYGPIYIHTNTVWNMTGGEISENTSYLPNYVRNNNPAGKMSGGKIVNNELTCGDYSNGYYVTHSDLRLNGKTEITGGSFTQDVFEHLAPNYGLAYNEETGVHTVTTDIAEVNGIIYHSIDEAAAAAKDGETVKVLVNHKVNKTTVIEKNVTLDMNGKFMLCNAEIKSAPVIRVLSDVTVVGSGKIDGRPGESCYAFIVGNGTTPGNLTLKGKVTYYGDVSAVSVTKGKLTVEGGNFAVNPYVVEGQEDNYNFVLNCIDANYKDGSAVIEVKGGTFYKFNPEKNAAEGTGTDFVPAPYYANEDKTNYWTVYRSYNYVAQVGETKYESLSEAVAAANQLGTATVTLLKDVTLGEKLTISGNVTIEGEYTITRDDSYTGTLFEVPAGATLTLDGKLVIDGGNNWTLNKNVYDSNLANGVKGTKRADVLTAEANAPKTTAAMFVVNGTVNANKVTIQNSYSDKDSNGGDSTIFKLTGTASLTMTGATIKHIATGGANAVVYMKENTSWIINEGTLIDDTFAGRNGGVSRIDGNARIVMNGGTISNSRGINVNGTVFMFCNKTTFKMNGGTICGNSGLCGANNGRLAPVYLHDSSSMTMTGGNICHNTGYLFSGIDIATANAKLTISDGNVYGNETISNKYNYDDVAPGGHTTITGGWYSQDVTEWCAEDYFCVLEYNAEIGKELYHVVDKLTVTVTVNDVTYVEGNEVPSYGYTTNVKCPELDITYTVDGDVINATVTEMDGYEFTVVPGKLTVQKALIRVDVSKPKEQKFFVSLQEALDFAAAQTVACNVFLLDNITVTEPIVYTDTKADNVELQSIKTGKNTYTLTSTCDEALFTVNGNCRFSIKNLVINAKGDAFYVNSGSLTLQGAYQGKQELYVTSETGNCVYVRGGSVSIRSNVYLTANGEYPAIQGNGNYVGNVSFGDWIASDPGVPQVSAPNSDMAIYWPGNGNLTIDYGVFTGDTAVYAKSGKITINGGEFYGTGEKKDFVHSSNGASATGDALVIENCKDAAYETPVVSITGGTFTSKNAKSVAVYNCNESTKVEKFISGGFFNVEPDAELPIEGYGAKRYSKSLWTVGPMTGTITVDGVWFAGWDEAETAFVQDCVIKLYGDVFNTGDCKALSGKGNVTLDLNGYTLSTPTKGVNTIWVSNKTVLNVIDSTGGGKIAMGSMSYPLNAYTNGKVIFAEGIQFIGSLQSTNGSGSFFFGETELLGANGIFQTNGKTARIGIQENGDWTVSIGTLTMTADYALADNTLTINKGYSINLNGNNLTAKNISVFGNLIDTADGVGAVTAEKLWFNGHNNGGYLPLKDEAVGGYRLFATELVNKGGREQTATFVKFGFTVKLNKTNAYELLDKAAQNGMLTANASWTAAGETEEKSFEYSENALRNHAIAALAQLEAGKTVTSTMILNIYGQTPLTSGDQVTGYAELSTDTGVVIGSETVTYTKN